MDLNIAGRKALVLGGNRGMGLAIAQSLSAEGVEIALAARDRSALESAAETLGGARAFTVDLSNTASLDGFAGQVGPVDILINNTGGPPYGSAIGRGVGDWEDSFRGMSLSIIKLTDLFLPAMRANRWGRIVTVVSAGAVQPIPVLGISNTLRAGLIAWSKSLANEIAGEGVTANILMPGRVATDRVRLTDEATAQREGLTVAEVEQRSWSQIPVGRYAEPDEIAAVVTFLCGQPASYMTGSVVRVDGGIVRHV
ncbi:MAG: SDR family oxidoreductase [Novosphingobium sp.]